MSFSHLQVLYNQFKYFLNAFFLTMAITQFIPPLKVGYLFTYWAPLGFVIGVSIIREAIEDFIRLLRDKELNSRRYAKLTQRGRVSVESSNLKVGDIVYIEKGSRVPADMILLRTTEHSGAMFLKTDQLDGETDWKLRLAVPCTQKLLHDDDLLGMEVSIYSEKQTKGYSQLYWQGYESWTSTRGRILKHRKHHLGEHSCCQRNSYRNNSVLGTRV